MSDKALYQIIADELKSRTMDVALWTQAIATAEGDADRTEAVYIRLRFLDLKKSNLSLVANDAQKVKLESEFKQRNSEIMQLRSSLAKKLQAQGKTSLYSILSLQPEASDEVVASAIADLESRSLSNSDVLSAEFKYAKSTLGNPALREQYDRKLLESVSYDLQGTSHSYSYESVGDQRSWFDSSRMSAIIRILFIGVIGYFALSYYKERNHHEIQKESLETEREVSYSVKDTNQLKTQAEIDQRNLELRIANERQRQEMDLRASAVNRLLDQQGLEQERRDKAEQQRLALQQTQAENLRISKEKQYYSCMNQQLLSQRDVTTGDAYARCSMYR